MKRIALVLAMTMVLAALGSGVAAADPVNSKKAEFFDLIPFRFVDGIMWACQRYSTHR